MGGNPIRFSHPMPRTARSRSRTRQSKLERFGDGRPTGGFLTFEVGDGPCDPQHAPGPPGREAQAFHGLSEEIEGLRLSGDLLIELAVANLRVAGNAAGALSSARREDAGAHEGTRLGPFSRVAERLPGDLADAYGKVDPVEERPGQAPAVSGEGGIVAAAIPVGRAVETAGDGRSPVRADLTADVP